MLPRSFSILPNRARTASASLVVIIKATAVSPPLIFAYNIIVIETILKTKLYKPPLRPYFVPRPQLIAKLNSGLDGKLTLVSAPAGFGKTTLLAEWLATQSTYQTSWLSLNGRDNDPHRFLAYFIAALQKIDSQIGRAFGDSSAFALPRGDRVAQETKLIALLNEIAEIEFPFVLVLDDYHLITNSEIQNILTFLLDNLPPKMHLVIATRADPPWALSRWRVHQAINEIRAKDLRFTTEEAYSFLNDEMALSLAQEDIVALETRTEGWIAGLQLAALTLQKESDKPQFIQSFANSNRFVFDYLAEEVLERQSPEMQHFLLQTSILAQINSDLCDALLQESESQQNLNYLEQNNLFLLPLDDEQRWYRYHHLFADLLQNKLRQTNPAQIPVLHLRAADWLAQQGMIAEAVGHARAANDFEQMVQLVKGNAFAMLDMGQLATLQEWLQLLPEEVVQADPWMSVFYAWTLAYLGQTDSVEPHLQTGEHGLGDLSKEDATHLRGHVAAIRTFLAKVNGETDQAVQLGNEALALLPSDDYKTRAFVAAILGTVLQMVGNLAVAEDAFNTAVSASRHAGNTHMAIHTLCDLAGLQMLQGKLNKAEATCRQALQLAEEGTKKRGRPLPGADFAHARLSGILLRRNQLDAALHHAQQGVELSRRRGQADIYTFCLLALAAVQFDRHDEAGWRETIRQARQIERDSAMHTALIDFVAVELGLVAGDLETAVMWAEENGLHPDNEIQSGQTFQYLFLARILWAQNNTDDALNLLDRLLPIEEESGSNGLVIGILVLQAMAWQVAQNDVLALNALERAIALAAPEGYVRIFIDHGVPMQSLLQQLSARNKLPSYVNNLLVALQHELQEDVVTTAPDLLEEPLSERELDVLRLMATDLRAPDIAARLVVSVHTVRSHVKSIYRKMNVHSRHEAITEAQKRDLL